MRNPVSVNRTEPREHGNGQPEMCIPAQLRRTVRVGPNEMSPLPIPRLPSILPALAAWFVLAAPAGLPADGPKRTDSKPKPQVLRFEPEDPARNQREVPLKIYLPPKAPDHASAFSPPHPVILFSHGLGGSRENSAYLGEHWARTGYVCVFLQHPGSDMSVWKDKPKLQALAALTKAANAQNAIERFRDVPFVLDVLEIWNADPDHPLHHTLDLERAGLSGHSFGAVTTQALMGQQFPGNRTFAEPRLKAFLLMSPSKGKRLEPAESFGDIAAPVLCMTGTKDGSVLPGRDTPPESRREVFAALPPGDKYQLVLENAHHFAFTEREVMPSGRIEHHHPAILAISTQFWNAYLKEDASAKKWLQSEERVREWAGLLEADLWEAK